MLTKGMLKTVIGVALLSPLALSAPVRTHHATHAGRKKPAKGKTKAKTRGKTSRKKTATIAPRRSTQRTPAPDRYREIQGALAAKGYYKGPQNGEWGAESTDALQRFQRDQNLKGDGKLDSLSLIAMGLGPKRQMEKPSQLQP